MKTVPLHGKIAAGRVALVDDEDYDLVMRYRWTAWRDCRKSARPDRFYAMRAIMREGKSTTTRMHQVLTGWPLTDHIDRDGLNNQRSNLRPATARQNAINSRPPQAHSSQFKGVRWHKQSGRWQALIRDRGVGHELGFYKDEVDAALAYDAGAREIFGEFAYLNFPDCRERPERSLLFSKHPDVTDATIVALRADGLAWRLVAAEVGMSQTGVRMRWSIAVNGGRPDRPKRAG
jgi:hypothetical protein